MIARELEVATAAAKEAGALLVAEAARGELRGNAQKMIVDNEMGDLIVRALSAAFPEDGIVCEDVAVEPRTRPSASGRAWMIDPHDGTSDFWHGRRETSVTIGLVDRGEPVLGVVYAPCSDQVHEPVLGEIFGGRRFMARWMRGGALEAPAFSGASRGATSGGLRLPGAAPRAARADHAPSARDRASAPRGSRLALVSPKLSGERLARNQRALPAFTLVGCASVATRFALAAVREAAVGYTIRHPLAAWDFAGAQALLIGAGGDLVDPTGARIAWRGIEPVLPARLMGYIGAADPEVAREVAARLEAALFV